MQTKKYAGALMLVIIIAGLGAVTASAADAAPVTQPQVKQAGWLNGFLHGERNGNDAERGLGVKPAVVGTVSAVNGTTLTIDGRMMNNTAVTVYTVDAANAKVTKDHAASAIANIAVGDSVVVLGTTNGTTVTATGIYDGKIGKANGMENETADGKLERENMMNALPAGNGTPVVGGTVSSVLGTTITITNRAGVTYSIDATSTKVVKGNTPNATMANVLAGDNVIVQGTVNGTAVVANSIIDQGAPMTSQPETQAAAGRVQKQAHPGFLGKVGSFFSRIFGL